MAFLFEAITAAAAGFLSFLSPCVFPLIPSYLAMLSGTSVKTLKESTGEKGFQVDEQLRLIRRTALLRSIAFSLGFTFVFVILGLIFSQASAMIGGSGRTWALIAGLVIIILGLDTIFDFISFLRMEKRIQIQKRPQGYVSAFLFGSAFGAGWSPCVGPMLASILFMAGSGSLVKAGILLTIYSLGLAVPFIAASLFLGSLQGLMQKLKEHLGTVKLISGLILISIGLYMMLGDLRQLSALFTRWGYTLQSSAEAQPQLFQMGTAVLYALLAVIILFAGKQSGKGAKNSRFILKAVLAALFALLAVLELTGTISTIRLISSWLMFQGV
ncbi:cytochrome c biogenesis CcdA family protein [Gracilinema caldarium]|uniref:Cytochrome c biogenesis protein transmembrane region n=1 Tax=Gracilinema caldarium (strain ATCC 51460 / DSM 7334 / H1) TaxID=744872 RepID=F8F0M8_GRAC1|nr:cytochrome c biogenesis protein CcdA [Gracilinema caldarium]AEJ19735.1 cytochrome c biogenesis protein transmembrane region [Gracilinema caldarium DSM 7334]